MKKFVALLPLLFPAIACVPAPGGGTGTPPANGPTSVAFSDQDPSSQVSGPITIGRAVDESDIDFYNIRFGSTGCTPVGVQIAQIIRAGTGDIVYNMPATSVPATAQNILVFTKNLGGENPNCMSTPINNDQPTPEPPAQNAVAVSFSDTDLNATVGGPINITKATSETTITHYVIRWGTPSHCNISGGGLIAEVAKTGSNIVYNLPAGTALPGAADEILVYTKNEFFETTNCDNVFTTVMNNEGPALPPNVTADGVTFTDTDAAETIGGVVAIDVADSEPTITSYVIRWGDSSHNNVGSSVIAQLGVTGSNLNYTIPTGTVVPSGATELLVYSKNAYGEMANGDNVYTDINNVVPQTWLHIRYTNDGQCLKAKSGTGPRINAAACDASGTDQTQQWFITPNGSDAGGATYEFKNRATGLCVKDLGTNNSNQSFFPVVEFFFELVPCGGTYQSFNIYHQSGTGAGQWFIRNKARNACFYRYSAYNGFDLYAAGGNCNWATLGYPYMKYGFINAAGTEVDPPTF